MSQPVTRAYAFGQPSKCVGGFALPIHYVGGDGHLAVTLVAATTAMWERTIADLRRHIANARRGETLKRTRYSDDTTRAPVTKPGGQLL